MKKLSLFTLVLFSAVVLTACSSNGSPNSATQTTSTGAPAADQKSGDTTKTGTLTTASGKFYLQEPGNAPREIESYSVELDQYVGQTVTVTGQYSGDTLFVGSIE